LLLRLHHSKSHTEDVALALLDPQQLAGQQQQ
jgi:hypothetical protein